jgi:FlaA1/EpsC-like NDP-sugar epimerase
MCWLLVDGLQSRSALPVYLGLTGPALTLLVWGVLAARRVYLIEPRYLGQHDFMNLGLAACVGIVGYAALAASVPALVPEGVSFWLPPVLFGCMLAGLLGGARALYRTMEWRALSARRARRYREPRRTLIVGAGDAGELVAREIVRSRTAEQTLAGFVDDDPAKLGLVIHGARVLGSTQDIPDLVEAKGVDDILIAIPSADGRAMRRVYDICDRTGARVRTLPPVPEVVTGLDHITHQLRQVRIEDLLRREPARTDLNQCSKFIAGETVLVTGGGGSIGAELARQIASLSPGNLVLAGKGENSIYEIEQELIDTRGLRPTCVIADVRDRASLEAIFQAHQPTVVFHAAAHKHVPLMQSSPIEAIRNNVLGTWTVADLSARAGVRKFVYISTDKAVRPTSVMGATKRVGEMIVRAMASRSETQFSIVRFGNVLGSRGSLIPMLEAQIRRGGPLRLTHPDMTRYFMTIPEAVQLILQAGAMGTSGELFLLDMGEPVKIYDLAKDLVRLHGLVPGEDIEFVFTGIRPGEKTHEELVYEEEELQPTAHQKIRVVRELQPIELDWMRGEVSRLTEACDAGNPDLAKQRLMEIAWGKTLAPYAVVHSPVDAPVHDPVDDPVHEPVHEPAHKPVEAPRP